MFVFVFVFVFGRHFLVSFFPIVSQCFSGVCVNLFSLCCVPLAFVWLVLNLFGGRASWADGQAFLYTAFGNWKFIIELIIITHTYLLQSAAAHQITKVFSN